MTALREARDQTGIKRAKELRREMSPPERAMWRMLRAGRLDGWKFTRQVPVGPYIVDFAARRERLAIELDGDSHARREAYDAQRTEWLESDGWKVIRFSNRDMMGNEDGVAMRILEELVAISPSPRPSPRRGEGE